jgi:Kef-type K+ transport system membrane component KefB
LLASLLIASMFASHTLVAYPIISRLGLVREKSIAAAVGGTILTDTAALLVLAVVARSVDGNLGITFWLTLTAMFSLYLVFMFYILPRISYSFFKAIGENGRFTYVYVIGVMLIVSWMAELIGVEAIIGAFLAGLSFNRLLTNKGPLKNRVEFFGDAFFIPLFLIYVGMLVEVEVLTSSTEVWLIMGLMTATVIVTKWLAAFSSAKILGFNNDQAWVIFGLTNTQAAATLAAVFVGMEIGLIGEEVLNGAIIMILVTCIIGPIVVEKFGLRIADDVTLEMEPATDIRQRILVPMANPTTSARLIEFAANIKTRKSSSIYPLSVINTFKDAKGQRDRAQKILELASGHIHAVNAESEPLIETNINIAEGIRIAANNNGITDIVIGWNGKISTTIRVFGSIVDQMLNTTNQQVFVCKLDQPVSTFTRLRIVIAPRKVHGTNFLQLFGSIMKIAENLNTPVEIYVLNDERDYIKRNLKILSNDIDTTIHEFSSFDVLMQQVMKDLAESDLLVVTNKRAGNYGWAYGINLVPRMMADQKPGNSFVIAYPLSSEPLEYKTDLIYSN